MKLLNKITNLFKRKNEREIEERVIDDYFNGISKVPSNQSSKNRYQPTQRENYSQNFPDRESRKAKIQKKEIERIIKPMGLEEYFFQAREEDREEIKNYVQFCYDSRKQRREFDHISKKDRRNAIIRDIATSIGISVSRRDRKEGYETRKIGAEVIRTILDTYNPEETYIAKQNKSNQSYNQSPTQQEADALVQAWTSALGHTIETKQTA